MSRAASLLALANAKGGSYQAHVAGGVVRFTGADVGHALAGYGRKDGTHADMQEGAYRLLLVKYSTGTEGDRYRLERALIETLEDARAWDAKAGRAAACKMAITEFLSARRCQGCEGRQHVLIDNRLEPCAACDATGYRQMSERQRALMLHLPFQTYLNGPAQAYYNAAFRTLIGWEDGGLGLVARKLRED